MSRRALITVVLLVFGYVALARAEDPDYNPPITQADDTASEMGRQREASEARDAQAREDAWVESERARDNARLQAQIDEIREKQKSVDTCVGAEACRQ